MNLLNFPASFSTATIKSAGRQTLASFASLTRQLLPTTNN
jgi:hypothetical protein